MSDDLPELVAALEAAGCTIRGKSVVCAFHGDRSASGSIYVGADGRHRYKCHSCEAAGDAADVTARTTGRPLAEILKERSMPNTAPRRQEPEPQRWPTLEALIADVRGFVDVARYKDASGAVIMAVIRLDPKSFRQASPAPGGGWWMKKPPGLLPILGIPAIAKAETVIVCEGEKDVKALHGVGFVATTAPMGADASTVSTDDDGKPGLADWSPLAGKRVILMGDDDESGRRHILRVARILGKLHPRPALFRVRREDLDGAKDAADLIAGTGSDEAARHAVQRLIDNAIPLRAASVLHRRIDDAIAGRITAIPFPWAAVGGLTQALLPGTASMLVGGPGATKSFMILQAVIWWLQNGWRVAILELEGSLAFWLNRALALITGAGGTTDPAWLAANSDMARAMLARHAQELDEIAAAITTAPADGMTLDQIAMWVEQQAKAGARIIIVDPISAAVEGDTKPWIAARAFTLKVGAIASQYGASVIMTSHARKGDARNKQGPDLDSVAGGAAWVRFSDTILWLEVPPDPEAVTVLDSDGRERGATINRRVRILKARSGRGTGMVLGMHFDGATLRTAECGIIITEAQSRRANPVQTRDAGHGTALRRAPGPHEDHFDQRTRAAGDA